MRGSGGESGPGCAWRESKRCRMESRGYTEIIGTKTKQVALDFLSSNSEKEFSVQELHNLLSLPESTLCIGLNELQKSGVVTSQKRGKFKYYRIVQDYAPILLSVFRNLSKIAPAKGVRRNAK